MNFTSPPVVSPGDTLYNSPVNPGLHLGQVVYTRDGRKYRFAKAGATALTPGQLGVSAAVAATQLALAIPNAVPVGARSFVVTGAAASPANTFAGGLAIVSTGAGQGQVFGIKSHDAIVAGPFTLTLESDDAVTTALVAATSKIDLVASPYAGVVPSPGAALASTPAGVANGQIDIGNYGFLQVEGLAAVLVDGTPAVGQAVSPSGAVAGAVAINATTAPIVGNMAALGVAGRTMGCFLLIG